MTTLTTKDHQVQQVRRWRDRQAAKTAGTGLVVQAVSYAIRAAIIPISLKVLGVDRYGLWLAIGSFVAWGGLADLGLSTGLANAVARSWGQDDLTAVRGHISTALAAYVAIATALAGTALLIANWEWLPRLLGTGNNPGLAHDAHLLAAICGVVFALTIWGQSFSTICSGLQEGYLGSFPVLAGRIVSLAFLMILFWRGASVFSYALVMLLPQLAAQFGLGVLVFGWRHPELRPSWRLCNRDSLRVLSAIGGPMAFDQLATIGILYSANVLVSNRLSPAMVPKYAIPYSLFAIVNGAAYLIADSYMPAYAEASGSEDWVWIRRRALRSLYLITALVAGVNAVLVVVGRTVIALWAGRPMVPPLSFLIALAFFGLLMTCTETNGVLLVGLGLVKVKAVLQFLAASTMVVGGWFLLPKLGLSAIPIVGSIGYVLSGALALPRAFRELRNKESDGLFSPVQSQLFLQEIANVE